MAEAEVEHLVSDILQHVDPGSVVTKFIVIIEGIDTDGQRAIYLSTNDQATKWDNYGLLQYALAKENADNLGL